MPCLPSNLLEGNPLAGNDQETRRIYRELTVGIACRPLWNVATGFGEDGLLIDNTLTIFEDIATLQIADSGLRILW